MLVNVGLIWINQELAVLHARLAQNNTLLKSLVQMVKTAPVLQKVVTVASTSTNKCGSDTNAGLLMPGASSLPSHFTVPATVNITDTSSWPLPPPPQWTHFAIPSCATVAEVGV